MEISPWGFPPVPTPLKSFRTQSKKCSQKDDTSKRLWACFQWIILRQKFSSLWVLFSLYFSKTRKNYPISKQLLFSRVTADRLNSFFYSKVKIQIYRFLRNRILFENACSVSFFQRDISWPLKEIRVRNVKLVLKFYRVRWCERLVRFDLEFVLCNLGNLKGPIDSLSWTSENFIIFLLHLSALHWHNVLKLDWTKFVSWPLHREFVSKWKFVS